MDPVAKQVGERVVDRALAGEAAHCGKGGRFDGDGEMAFAAAVVAGMAAVSVAVIGNVQPGRSQRRFEAFDDFRGERAGENICHFAYIEALLGKGSGLASSGKRQTRFHGRVEQSEGHAVCAFPGCAAPGEFRAPPADGRRPGFDGPGEWRWLCLDHVREFNAGYNYFQGMSADEISDAQNPYGGWDRETRAFAARGGDATPRWADFTDPLDAIGARFRRADAEGARSDGRELSAQDRKSLRVLGLGTDVDRRGLRTRYAELVRRFHPDRNGGDRSHEKALQAVIHAYTQLKSRPAFA